MTSKRSPNPNLFFRGVIFAFYIHICFWALVLTFCFPPWKLLGWAGADFPAAGVMPKEPYDPQMGNLSRQP